MKKIISFDFDMTLLNHADYKIPDSALRALDLLRSRGHKIVLATGRDMGNHHGRPFYEMIRPDAMIELNGTKITIGEELFYRHYFDKALLRRLMDFCIERGYSIGVTVGEEDYYLHPEKVREFDIKTWGQSMRRFADPERLMDLEVGTLAYVGYEEGAREIEKHFPALKCRAFAGVTGADVIEHGNSKAEGLKRLCDYFGIDLSDTVAFGDSMNDYEILSEAGIGVAMGNAVDELKRIADLVTDDIDKDGIFNACIRLGLIGA